MKMKRLALTMLCMFTLGGAVSAQSQETGAISTTPKGTILVVASSQTKMEMKASCPNRQLYQKRLSH